MDPLPTINKVFSLASQEERQRKLSNNFDNHGIDSRAAATRVTQEIEAMAERKGRHVLIVEWWATL